MIEIEPETVGGPAPPLDAVLGLMPPYYVDVTAGLTGPLDLGLPDAIAARLAAAPSVSATEAAALAVALEHRVKAIGFADRVPLPKPALKTELRARAPVPRLELLLAPVRIKPQYSWYSREARHRGTFQLPLARLAFDYAGEVVPAHAATQMLERLEGELLVVTPRDGKVERAAFERLGKLGLKGSKDGLLETGSEHANDMLIAPGGAQNPHEALAALDDHSRYIAFSAEAVPQLRSEGWQIAYSDDYPYRVAEGEVAWWADIGEGSGIDWFSFELGIEFEGQRISLAPQLASMLSRLPAEVSQLALSPDPTAARELMKRCKKLKLYHTLPDGRLLPLPGDRMAPILKGLIELIGPRSDAIDNGRVKLHRAEAAALAALADALGTAVAWGASTERLIALGKELQRGRGLKEVTPPPGLRASCAPTRPGSLLARVPAGDGLRRRAGRRHGPRQDAADHRPPRAEKEAGRLDRPALIVAPTSVVRQLAARGRALRADARRAGAARRRTASSSSATSPPRRRAHHATRCCCATTASCSTQAFHLAILDEAQAIKNPRATRRAARRSTPRHRLCLTGTPIENHLGELWSLFDFLTPGLLGDADDVPAHASARRSRSTATPAAQASCAASARSSCAARRRRSPGAARQDRDRRARRARRRAARALREHPRRRARRGAPRDREEGPGERHIAILDALMKLRQVCCDPRLLKLPAGREGQAVAKLELLLELLASWSPGRRMLRLLPVHQHAGADRGGAARPSASPYLDLDRRHRGPREAASTPSSGRRAACS